MRFEFRAELFNVWNHTNLLWGPIGALGQAEPVAIEVGTPQFGFAQAARGGAGDDQSDGAVARETWMDHARSESV